MESYIKQTRLSTLQDLYNYLDNLEVDDMDYLEVIPEPVKQKGQTCKIAAISNVLQAYYEAKKLSAKPLPTYKLKNASLQTSARQVAKEKTGSQVGEIYNEKNLKTLIKELGIAANDKTVSDATVTIMRFDDEEQEEYIDYIISQIKAQTPAIVFFDVDDFGFPLTDGHGKREHAAIVIGYIQNEGRTSFILAHWGRYFIVNAKELFISANNLQSFRTRETFLKVTIGEDYHEWHELNPAGKDWPSIINDFLTPLMLKNMKPDEDYDVSNKVKIIKKIGGSAEEQQEEGFKLSVCTIKPALKNIFNPKPQTAYNMDFGFFPAFNGETHNETSSDFLNYQDQLKFPNQDF